MQTQCTEANNTKNSKTQAKIKIDHKRQIQVTQFTFKTLSILNHTSYVTGYVWNILSQQYCTHKFLVNNMKLKGNGCDVMTVWHGGQRLLEKLCNEDTPLNVASWWSGQLVHKWNGHLCCMVSWCLLIRNNQLVIYCAELIKAHQICRYATTVLIQLTTSSYRSAWFNSQNTRSCMTYELLEELVYYIRICNTVIRN